MNKATNETCKDFHLNQKPVGVVCACVCFNTLLPLKRGPCNSTRVFLIRVSEWYVKKVIRVRACTLRPFFVNVVPNNPTNSLFTPVAYSSRSPVVRDHTGEGEGYPTTLMEMLYHTATLSSLPAIL
jgi:hypothetical protein